ncbi:MAG TPA: hypothetical protein VF523_18975 [Burkholderiales bacterium]
MAKAAAVVGFISREDYAEYRAVCADGDAMPSDYKVFLKTYNQELGELRASGVSPTQMNIKPGKMAEWCKANGHAIDCKGRAAYANHVFSGLNIKSPELNAKR